MIEARIEKRPGGARAERGHNPFRTRHIQTGIALLRAGGACKFCDRQATRLIASGGVLACAEHAQRYHARRVEKRGF